MQKLGHENINTTMIYTHILGLEAKEEYYSAVAQSVEEARKLVENGFEFVTDVDSTKLFRKRK